MRVKIGKYPDRIICNLYSNYMGRKYGYCRDRKDCSKVDKIIEKVDDFIQDYPFAFLNWLYFDRRNRKIDVKIHNYDCWSMDTTLAHIIVPMLEILKESKQGAPNVDCEDVQEELRPTEKEVELFNHDGTTDDKFFKRWNYVVGEMIWAFTFIRDEDLIEYFDKNNLEEYYTLQSRIDNGTRLFGKYYKSLWD